MSGKRERPTAREYTTMRTATCMYKQERRKKTKKKRREERKEKKKNKVRRLTLNEGTTVSGRTT